MNLKELAELSDEERATYCGCEPEMGVVFSSYRSADKRAGWMECIKWLKMYQRSTAGTDWWMAIGNAVSRIETEAERRYPNSGDGK